MLKSLMGLFSKASSSAGASSSAPPTYVYKLVTHPTVNQRYAFPIPIPASHEFAISELDAKASGDGFIHLSTADQVQGTLERFFPQDQIVTLFKVDFGRLAGFKVVKWEKASNGQEYPHLYAVSLEGEYIDSFRELARGDEGRQPWAEVIEKARREGWLQH
ncbi:BQ5605_C007g04695 [Microbotryum silenes-dioicae]|uniref:BQ5605_C007g04695 protein n=1 Tax=Microbotryum silenes-dioicae TaxID=796604 RepID=A0A2X0MC53_9BASI|nr:BQ5605_C007g04695 [Microbotryum silenes-dioicae]